MSNMRRRRLMALLLALFCSTSSPAFGYSYVVSLGDSLSDNGNLARLTNGDVWVELLADHFSAPLVNIAYAGATTGFDNPAAGLPVTGLQWQVDQLASIPDSSLVTVFAGANDLLQSRPPVDAAINIDLALENLYLAGGRDFVVPNLPDIGSVPSIVDTPLDSEVATFWTLTFNTTLEDVIQGFEARHSDVDLFFIDTFGRFSQFPVGSSQWRELFWVDGFHPSSIGHQLIFETALAEVDPVPEPSAILLFLIGVSCLAVFKMRRRYPAP